MKQQNNFRVRYATLYYHVLKDLDISINEYVLLDMIFKLSIRDGYCYKTRTSMAEDLGFTRRGVQKLIAKLVDKELLIRHKDGFKVTEAYIEVAEVERVNKVRTYDSSGANKVPNTANKVRGGCEQSTTKNNNRITKNNKGEFSENKERIKEALRVGRLSTLKR